jgi:LPXTG-motif cell wall-anchored protein
MLPATGSNATVVVVAATLLVAVGVATVVLARRRTLPMLAVLLLAGVIAVSASPADAATGCPSPTTSVATAPTAPTTTSPYLRGIPLEAEDDILGTVLVGQPISFNLFANDYLGDPPAVVEGGTGPGGGQAGEPACRGLRFYALTGEFSGTPTTAGTCSFEYWLFNGAGPGAIVDVVLIVSPPTTSSTTPPSTTPTTTPVTSTTASPTTSTSSEVDPVIEEETS